MVGVIFHYALFGFIFPVLCFKKMQLQFHLKVKVKCILQMNFLHVLNFMWDFIANFVQFLFSILSFNQV